MRHPVVWHRLVLVHLFLHLHPPLPPRLKRLIKRVLLLLFAPAGQPFAVHRHVFLIRRAFFLKFRLAIVVIFIILLDPLFPMVGPDHTDNILHDTLTNSSLPLLFLLRVDNLQRVTPVIPR